MNWRAVHGAGRVFVFGCLGAVLMGPAAQSQNIGNMFLNALQNGVVAGAWNKVDQPTKDCLANQYNEAQDALIQQGILPSDPRVAPNIQACRQAMAARQQQDQQQLANQAQQTEQQREQAALAAQQSSPQLKAARKRELTAKYGSKMAALILSGQLKVGMTKDEVTESWGSPSAVDNGTTGQEKWSYGSDIAVFTNGKLSDVEH